MRADLDVQMAKAKAHSATTWSGTETVCAAVQRGKTLNYVVMTMRLSHGGVCEPSIHCLMAKF